jgi:hypothetical protein
MSTIGISMGRHYRPIIFSLVLIIVFFSASCTFHSSIPICHYVFGCDHSLHTTG